MKVGNSPPPPSPIDDHLRLPSQPRLQSNASVFLIANIQYLLGYLKGINDAPQLSDPDFQQLLVDVSAGKVSCDPAHDRIVADPISIVSINRFLLLFTTTDTSWLLPLRPNRPMHSTTAWRRW